MPFKRFSKAALKMCRFYYISEKYASGRERFYGFKQVEQIKGEKTSPHVRRAVMLIQKESLCRVKEGVYDFTRVE